MRTQWTGRAVTDTIGDAVEDLRRALGWSDEANALGDVECDYDGDDQWGWLTMGPVRVEWTRDMYGDGNTEWVAVSVTYDGTQMDDVEDYGPDLDEAVKDAAHRTSEWQAYRADEIRDEIIEWLDSRCEAYDLQEPEDEHDAWMIFWRDVSIQGYFTEVDGAFEWSVSNGETGGCLDGDADSTADDVIEAVETCAADPMVEAWVETITECVAEDDWTVHVSDDGLTVQAHDPTDAVSRLATYGQVGFGEGRIGLLWRPLRAQWVPSDEHLPEDEDDVRRMAREAYAWVKAVSD